MDTGIIYTNSLDHPYTYTKGVLKDVSPNTVYT